MKADLFVDGVSVGPAKGHYEVIDPSTEAVAGHAPEASVDQLLAATEAADRAAAGWADVPVEERAAIVARMGVELEARRAEFVDLIRSETGATHAVAEPEQFNGALRFFAKWRHVESGDFVRPVPPFVRPGADGARLTGAAVHRAPIGVVAGIMPFNYPLMCATNVIGPALVAGNAVVLKPAPANPLAVFALGEVATAAGLPRGVLNIVGGRAAAIGSALVTAPAVGMISFTGSTAVGRAIAAAAGDGLKRVLLELGGKGAAIVFDDADLDAAVAAITSTWTRHAGQVCTAPTRIIAQRGIHHELMQRLVAAAELVVGDPRDPGTQVGPLTTREHRDRVRGYIDRGIAQGAGLAVATGPLPSPGHFVAPTLLTDCTPDMVVVREEIFGPVVVALAPFDTPTDALRLATDSAFGLHDYIYTADTGLAFDLAKRLRTGYVGINTAVRSPDAPFGGIGLSGVGRDGGMFSLDAYTEPTSIIWTG